VPRKRPPPKAKDVSREKVKGKPADLLGDLVLELRLLRELRELDLARFRMHATSMGGDSTFLAISEPTVLYRNTHDRPVVFFAHDRTLGGGAHGTWFEVSYQKNGRRFPVTNARDYLQLILLPNEEVWWVESGGGAAGEVTVSWGIAQPLQEGNYSE